LPRLVIDGRTVEVKEGTYILEAARALGIAIPTLCALEGFHPEPACLVCVVKDDASGRFLPACAARSEEGMNVRTAGPEADRARAAALGLLAAEHGGDCEAPCRRGCPLAIDIDACLAHLRDNDTQAAADAFFAHNPFPALTGRLCAAPCEKTCRRRKHDAPVAIRLLERFAGDTLGGYLPSRAKASGKKTAVVGAGPAGLAAAFHLLRLGHDVTVFEKSGRAGGGLRQCVAGGKLPGEVLEREIERVVALGARFEFNTEAGKDISWDELRRGYDALVIASGVAERKSPGRLYPALTADGIAVDRETFTTSLPAVFAIGGAVKKLGASVHAFRQGWEAAQSARAFLATGSAAPGKKRFDSHLAALTAAEIARFAAKASNAPRREPAAGFSSAEAIEEARRCFSCACLKRDECAFREAVTAYGPEKHVVLSRRADFRLVDSHPDVVMEPLKCVKCGRCVRITRERREPVGLAFIGRGIEMTVGVPFDRALSDALTFTAAECVAACPTGALAWKRGKQR
jgi:ferredoxin